MGMCVSGWLCTGFDGDTDGILLSLGKAMGIDFSYIF